MTATVMLLTLLSLGAGSDGRETKSSTRPAPASELFVERVAGYDPVRVNVRCERHLARLVLSAIAKEGGLELELPEELTGYVHGVAIRAARPEDAIDAVAGSFGYLTRADGNRVRVERPPAPGEARARAWYAEKAQERFEGFLAFDGDHPDAPAAWLELACLREERGDFDGAIEALRSLREWNPSSPSSVDALAEIGRLQFILGDIDVAIATLVEVIDKHSANRASASAYALLGRCRLAADNVEMARRYFQIGIERFPSAPASVSSRIWCVDVQRRLGDVASAWEEVADLEAMPLTPSQAVELLEVRCHLDQATGRYADAEAGWLALASRATSPILTEKYLTQAFASARKAGDPLGELLVRAAMFPDRKRETVAAWLVAQGTPEAALRYRPDDPTIRLDAALARAAGGDLDRAEALLASTPITKETASLRKLVQAEIALLSKRPEDVPELLLAVVEASSDKAFVMKALDILARAYVLTGDYSQAEASLRGIIPKEGRR
jgi:tetratricopeptide (TPR) repeat protein